MKRRPEEAEPTSETIRDSFVEHFGEHNAQAIERAALQHRPDDRHGSDPFKWALLIAIGFDCLDRFAEEHKINADVHAVRAWAVEHANLRSHDGDFDRLSAYAGAYDAWLVTPSPSR